MEGDGHDSVGVPEGEFDAVAVVDVNVDVENSWVIPIIDITQFQS